MLLASAHFFLTSVCPNFWIPSFCPSLLPGRLWLYRKEHWKLLSSLKTTVEGLVSTNNPNVWSRYGGLQRLHKDTNNILSNGLKNEQVIFYQFSFLCLFLLLLVSSHWLMQSALNQASHTIKYQVRPDHPCTPFFTVVEMFWNKQRDSLALCLLHVVRNVLSILYSLPLMFLCEHCCHFFCDHLVRITSVCHFL